VSDQKWEVAVMKAVLPLTRLTEAQVIDLVTYRKDGTPVHTPVLSTPHDGALLIRTHHTAGKLRRLRHNAEVTVAPCYGRKERGPAERATAVILPASEVAQALALLHGRHGLIGLMATWIRHLRGMRDVFIEVRPV
jgi:PPOX class probable F420-dependent enzyme